MDSSAANCGLGDRFSYRPNAHSPSLRLRKGFFAALGQAAESDVVLAELIDKLAEGWPYNIAYVLAYRGEADRAFEWLDKAVQYKDPGLTQIPTQIEFTNIQNDPRWQPFLESIGKSPAQLDAIEFKVTLPE